MCYVLLVMQLLRLNGFLWIFSCVPLCFSSLSDPWCYLQTPCVSADFFPVCCRLFPIIHIWAFVYHSSMFRVVDVLCAVSYTVAEYEWIFPVWCGFLPVCHFVYTYSSLSDPWCYLQTLCLSADFFLSVVYFSRRLLLVICASVRYVQSSWCAMWC